jgi:hypothetical protein
MSQVAVGVLLCAGLFVLFGLLPHRGCTGHCTGCAGECGRRDIEGEDHAG